MFFSTWKPYCTSMQGFNTAFMSLITHMYVSLIPHRCLRAVLGALHRRQPMVSDLEPTLYAPPGGAH